jgi:hypothetical protein
MRCTLLLDGRNRNPIEPLDHGLDHYVESFVSRMDRLDD